MSAGTGVFGLYARFYDALYREKDYAGEARFVLDSVRSHAPATARLLELGCGTGAHAVELARLGCDVTGIDFSAEMVTRAEARRATLAPELGARLRFLEGDARACRVAGHFDAVLALFHVMSYQTADEDLRAAFATAAAHLRRGGIFFFDFWYGPAVLAQRPERREKRLEDEELELVRIAEPELDERASRVDVRYTVRARWRAGGEALAPVQETHAMRYFFLPELKASLDAAGFALAGACAMASGAPLDERTWSACAVARRH